MPPSAPVARKAAPPELGESLHSSTELADYFGVTRATIGAWVKAGTLPPPIRIGHAHRWRAGDIERLVSAGGPAR